MSEPDRNGGTGRPTIWGALTHGRTLFSILMFCIFAVMVVVARDYSWPANFLPYVIGIPGMMLTVLQITLDIREYFSADGKIDPRTDFERYMDDLQTHTEGLELDIAKEKVQTIVEDHSAEALSRNKREIVLFAYFFFLLAIVLLFGFWIGATIFLFLFLRFYAKESLRLSLLITLGVIGSMYLVLVEVLEQVIFEGFVTQYIIDTFFSD